MWVGGEKQKNNESDCELETFATSKDELQTTGEHLSLPLYPSSLDYTLGAGGALQQKPEHGGRGEEATQSRDRSGLALGVGPAPNRPAAEHLACYAPSSA